MKQRFYYCPKCGKELQYRQIGDRQRLRCHACGYVFYENPIVGVAGIYMQDNQILLGRRTNGYAGQWCIPCGYVEWDEDVQAALRREFKEETGLEVCIERVYTAKSNFHNPESHTVGIWFLVTPTGGQLQAGDDLDMVQFFTLDNLPDLAFPTDLEVIEMLRENCS